MEQAAKTLQTHIIDLHYRREDFAIGMGSDRLHIYCHFPASRWRGVMLNTWDGFPIEWHFGVGRAKAFAA